MSAHPFRVAGAVNCPFAHVYVDVPVGQDVGALSDHLYMSRTAVLVPLSPSAPSSPSVPAYPTGYGVTPVHVIVDVVVVALSER